VISNQPVNCSLGAQIGARLGVPQFETDQTYVGLVRVAPHERVVLGHSGRATLIVAVDAGATFFSSNGGGTLWVAEILRGLIVGTQDSLF